MSNRLPKAFNNLIINGSDFLYVKSIFIIANSMPPKFNLLDKSEQI